MTMLTRVTPGGALEAAPSAAPKDEAAANGRAEPLIEATQTKIVAADHEIGSPAEENDSQQTLASGRNSVSEGSIRVDVALLNKLMNLVGELVLERNQVLLFSNAGAGLDLARFTFEMDQYGVEVQTMVDSIFSDGNGRHRTRE